MGKPWSGGFGRWLQDTTTTWSARSSESPAPLSKGTRVGVAQAEPHDPTLVLAKVKSPARAKRSKAGSLKRDPTQLFPHTCAPSTATRPESESGIGSRRRVHGPYQGTRALCETHHIIARGYSTTQQGDRTKHSTALLPFALSARQLRATPYTCFHCDIVAVIRDDFHSVDDPGIALRCEITFINSCDSS